MTTLKQSGRVLRIGIVGLGEIAQVSHIDILSSLSDHFRITYLCDASKQALNHCAKKIGIVSPAVTSSVEALCSSPEVDVVLLCNATAFHPSYALLALQNDKYVLVEKPVALCYRDIDSLIEAEKTSKGKVFVGYQRRYAEAFLDAVAEVGGMEKVLYARIRDILGPNSLFVDQSGTFPQKFTDFQDADSKEMADKDREMVTHALVNEYEVEVNPTSMRLVRALGGLGTHDLSAMREMIGMPKGVKGAFLNFPFWTVLFDYNSFPVTYESGFVGVPIFDAHVEVYSADKIVRVNYDTPYIRGLPVTMTVQEKVQGRQGPGYQERIVRKTYENPYMTEFLDFHDCAANGKTPKTSVKDAREDLDLFKMILRAGM